MMTQKQQEETGHQVARIFEQPDDALSTYSDFAQILGTGDEVTLQFYSTIPDVPGPDGQIQSVRTLLRATIIVSKAHALNIGRLLLKNVGEPTVPSPATDSSKKAGA